MVIQLQHTWRDSDTQVTWLLVTSSSIGSWCVRTLPQRFMSNLATCASAFNAHVHIHISFLFGSSSFFTSLIPYVFHHSIGWGCQHVAALVVLCCNYLCLGSRLELSRDTAWHGNLLTICHACVACLPFNFIALFTI